MGGRMSKDELQAIFFGGALAVFVMSLLGIMMTLLPGCAAEVVEDCPPMPGPGPVYEATANRWEQEIGPLPDLTYLRTETREVPADGFTGCAYPDFGLLKGCSWWDDDAKIYRIEVLECRHDTAETLGHEYAHVLLWVTSDGQNPDPRHERTDVWGPVAAARVEGP